MNTPNIVVIGNIINETIIFPDRTIGPVLGSPAAYSSLVIARSGRQVGLVTYYGDDLVQGPLKELDAVDHTGFIKHPHSTTNRLIYNQQGAKSVEFVRKAPDLHFHDIPKSYLEAGTFYLCPMEYEVDTDICVELAALGKTVIVDLGGYGGATCQSYHSIHTPKGKAAIDALCRHASIIKASEEDMRHIYPDASPEEIFGYFFAQGAKVAVLTLGSKGSMYQAAGQGSRVVPVCPCRYDDDKSKLDFTGAGDSFGAGLVACYSETGSIAEAVAYGNAVASLVIEQSGGCIASRMPDAATIADRLQGSI